LDIHRDFHDEFSTSVFSSELAIPSNITAFLQMHGVPTERRTKIDEYCIKPKNALFILGTLAHNPGIEVSALPHRDPRVRAYRSAALARDPAPAHNLSPEQQAKLASVLTKAGISNPAAWAAAGISHPAPPMTVMAGRTAAAAAPAPENFDLHPPTVVLKGT